MTTASAQQQQPLQPEAHLDDNIDQRRADEEATGDVDPAGLADQLRDDDQHEHEHEHEHDRDDDLEGGLDDDEDDDEDDDGDVDQAFAEGCAFQSQQSLLALPGLFAALLDSPFSLVAQAAVERAAEDGLPAARAAWGGPAAVSSTVSERITAIVRASQVLQMLLALEIVDLRLNGTEKDVRRLAALGSVGERIAASDGLAAAQVAREIIASEDTHAAIALVERIGLVHDGRFGQTLAVAMMKPDNERKDYALGLLLGIIEPGERSTALHPLIALLALAGAPAGGVGAALQQVHHALNDALPWLLSVAPASQAVWTGRLPSDDPAGQAVAGDLLSAAYDAIRQRFAPVGAAPERSDANAAPEAA